MNRLAQATRYLFLVLLSTKAGAGEVDVLNVEIYPGNSGQYRFAVTLKHADSGWSHYANRWEILSPDGELLATRVLHHPHVDEQPFTRSLNSVELPAGLRQVIVRGHDSEHGYGGSEYTVELGHADSTQR